MFAVICNHYSVPEEKWMEMNGDAMRIADELKDVGKEVIQNNLNDFYFDLGIRL